jgi:maleylpyruvate isomerase
MPICIATGCHVASGDVSGSQREVGRDVELARVAHRRLLDDLDRLVAAGALDVTDASALPGWTKGHVITHVTNSGDGHALIFGAAARGQVGRQYPHGVEGRAADIEAGAARPAPEQVDGLRASIERLEALWASTTWRGSGLLSSGGEVHLAGLPFLRLREVAIHHIDLRIGATFADLPSEYVRRELVQLEMLWKARQPMGLTTLPATALALTPPDRLAWLSGRRQVEGLAPANVW